MKIVDRYLLTETLRPFVWALLLALMVLLVERILRIFDMILGTQGPLKVLVQMLTYLVPQYIGLVLPIGLFLGVLLGFRRLNRDSEIDVFQATGIAPHRLLRPVLLNFHQLQLSLPDSLFLPAA